MSGDFDALWADYADDAALLTIEGVSEGKPAIQTWYVNMMTALPRVKQTLAGHQVHGDVVLATWSADSPLATVPHGVETFAISDDKIRTQTVWFTVAPR